MKEIWELDPDRLGTTDEEGHRVFVYPADVRGRIRLRRTRVQAILITIFLILPWLKIDGRQALLFDIPRRNFEIFGFTLRAHDAPLFFFVLATIALGIALITAIWGRLWCGWGCPQTVFIDGVYRRIERWIEGSALQRMKADQGPMTANLFLKKSLKWAVFIGVTFVLTHSFLAYFVGAQRVVAMVQRPPSENWFDFVLIMVTSGILLFNFTWFREQFCIIMCPYGRLQSVLMDENSMVVAYDPARGEPRKSKTAAETSDAKKTGDCVNCYRCVQVCPTRIDIRRGTQMECIACAACVDACDEVMTRLKKPTGLIRYDTELGLQGKKPRALRVRTLIYGALLAATLSGFFSLLFSRPILQATIIRAKGLPYEVQKMENGREDFVINRFQVDLSNQDRQAHEVRFAVSDELKAKGLELVTPIVPLVVPPDELRRTPLFIRFPKSLLRLGKGSIRVRVLDQAVPSTATRGAPIGTAQSAPTNAVHGAPMGATPQSNEFEKEAILVGPLS
jgi:cytochrome c oxidase accessory protein FixG